MTTSLSQQKRDANKHKPLRLSLSKDELRVYDMWAKEYYSTQIGLYEIIDTDLCDSDIVLGKVKRK